MSEPNPGSAEEAPVLSNRQVAARLSEVADLLESKAENPYKVRAYREAAETFRELARPAHEIVRDEGPEALRRLPGIGKGLAGAVRELVTTGRLRRLDELRAEVAPGGLLAHVAGLGPVLAGRVHDQLGISTLEELEQAAHDGRLAEVPGMGEKRLRAVRETLAARLSRREPSRARERSAPDAPPVEELLDVDREYREKAEAGELHRISPRRFNPRDEAWLPVLRTRRGKRRYSALYSNTAHAHRRGTTRDWVVVRLAGPNGPD